MYELKSKDIFFKLLVIVNCLALGYVHSVILNELLEAEQYYFAIPILFVIIATVLYFVSKKVYAISSTIVGISSVVILLPIYVVFVSITLSGSNVIWSILYILVIILSVILGILMAFKWYYYHIYTIMLTSLWTYLYGTKINGHTIDLIKFIIFVFLLVTYTVLFIKVLLNIKKEKQINEQGI